MSEPITPADARAEINRVLGDAAHPYWDRQHPEHRAAMERMQVLFAVKVGRFGPPIEYTTAREQDRAEGYRAGIEAALQAIETMLVTPSRSAPQYEVLHEAHEAIRALADKADMTDAKPATDAEIARIDTERAARLAAEARVKVLEQAIDNFIDTTRQECCGRGVGYGDAPECCGQPDLLVNSQALNDLCNSRAALKESANG